MEQQQDKIPGCAHCETKLPFRLPNQIIEAANTGTLSIFAGAGISTEGRNVFITSLYDEVAAELAMDPKKTNLSFPELMSRYCATAKGGRIDLLVKIKQRLDYLKSFPEVHTQATRFHKELATIPHVHRIFTTNWDDLFEQECAAQPIVSAEDFVFWDLPDRKVFKLHGSINNPGSLVITSDDYEKCYRSLNRGLLGSSLKVALATSTVLFVGYSLTDTDFLRIYSFMKKELKKLLPHAFGVTLSKESAERFTELGITPILTDAAHFLSILKEALVVSKGMLPDSWINPMVRALPAVYRAHDRLYEKFNHKKYPMVILVACYQDGLYHALEHLISFYPTGKYSDPRKIISTFESYGRIRQQAVRRGSYHDVAYIDGYRVGYALTLDTKLQRSLPKYYMPGYGHIYSLDELRSALNSRSMRRGRAYNYALRMSQKIPADLVYHHAAFL